MDLRVTFVNETIKEKRFRFFLIAFFVFVTAAAFLYRTDRHSVDESDYHSKALVIQQSRRNDKNPIVALYEYKNSQHVLAIFEIEKTNRYKFNTLHAVLLENTPEQLSPDQTGRGIWTKVNGDWLYFSPSLQEEKRDSNHRSTSSPYKTSLKVNNYDNKQITKINKEKLIQLSEGTKPIELHSLSADGLLWLVLSKKDVQIIETK